MDYEDGELRYFLKRYPALVSISSNIVDAYNILEQSFSTGGKLMIAGNGGSAADAEHIAGELMKRFCITRPLPDNMIRRLIAIDDVRGKKLSASIEKGLPTLSLVNHEALLTAYMNDVDAEGVFAQQICGYGCSSDVFLGISTSGNSDNIINAAIMARAMDIKVIALTGMTGGKLADYSDITVKVPETETWKIQELHLPIYHFWCKCLEEHFFAKVD